MSQTLTPPITGRLCTLPSELLFLITEYLNHREYITLWLVHPRLYQVLTSLRPLQLRLKENDPDITVAEHMRLIRHLAHHDYFYISNHEVHPIDHRLVGIQTYDCYTTDLYYRVWRGGECVMYNNQPLRARKMGYCYGQDDLIFTPEGGIFDGATLHDAKVARVFMICRHSVFYQDTLGRYLLWFRDGRYQVIESRYFRDVKDIYCSWFETKQGSKWITHPCIEYILCHNGKIYKMVEGAVGIRELQAKKITITHSNIDIYDRIHHKMNDVDLYTPIPIRKIHQGERILLSFDGTLIRLGDRRRPSYVAESYYEGNKFITRMLKHVTDMCNLRCDIYYLVEGRKVFHKDYNGIFRLIYTSANSYHTLRVFDSNGRVILCLGD